MYTTPYKIRQVAGMTQTLLFATLKAAKDYCRDHRIPVDLIEHPKPIKKGAKQ